MSKTKNFFWKKIEQEDLVYNHVPDRQKQPVDYNKLAKLRSKLNVRFEKLKRNKYESSYQ
jgi:hypothetical protein